MISELTDNEILDFLMTSDFDGDYSPEELKYLLFKWRYFYRLLDGNFERIKVELDGSLRIINEKNENQKSELIKHQIQLASKDNEINQLQTRKLTWKERISGKIIHNKDENK